MLYVLILTIAVMYYGRHWLYGEYFKRAISLGLNKRIDGVIFILLTDIGFLLAVGNVMLRTVYYPHTNIIIVPIVVGFAYFIRWCLYNLYP